MFFLSAMEFKPIFSLILFSSLTFFSIIIYSVYKRLNKTEHQIKNPQTPQPDPTLPILPQWADSLGSDPVPSGSGSVDLDCGETEHQIKDPLIEKSQPTHLPQSDSPNWVDSIGPDPVPNGPELDPQRVKKTGHLIIVKPDPTHSTWVGLFGSDPVEDGSDCDKRKRKKGKKKEEEEGCVYPFTTSSSVTQRKIKQQYDQLIKSHDSKGLTLAQVGQFVNCLVEARNDLKHKSEIIQRKFTITKALLLKANRSSFDRLSQQISKLELEHKRIEEDVFVYNWLQHQLKLSPAYKKMLEIGASMELKAKSMELAEMAGDGFSDISFEEFLEQEKKDSFWQKNGKPRSCSG